MGWGVGRGAVAGCGCDWGGDNVLGMSIIELVFPTTTREVIFLILKKHVSQRTAFQKCWQTKHGKLEIIFFSSITNAPLMAWSYMNCINTKKPIRNSYYFWYIIYIFSLCEKSISFFLKLCIYSNVAIGNKMDTILIILCVIYLNTINIWIT